MSLILDALNRSRQDSEQVPGLSANHFAEGVDTPANWLPWLLVCALACAVLAIGWLLYDTLPDPDPAAAIIEPMPAAAPEHPAVAASESMPPVQARAQPGTLAPGLKPAGKPDVGGPQMAMTPPSPPAAAPAARQPAKTAPSADAGQAAVDAGVTALYQQQERVVAGSSPASHTRSQTSSAPPAQVEKPVAASREEEVLDISQLVDKAQAELADARLSEHSAPFLSTLSQQAKDAVPTLMYQRHDYSGSPKGSRVLINGKTLRTGGAVSGVKVEEILPDSVVLEFQGTVFRLRALNSWVNL